MVNRLKLPLEALRKSVLGSPIVASDGNHSARLWRVAENLQSHALLNPTDDRLLHLMSRIGVLCQGLANDLRSGQTSSEEVATLLEQLASLGDVSFKEWRRSS